VTNERPKTCTARTRRSRPRFLRKLGVRGDEIDDARQDVFMQFFRYLAGFRAEAELKTWLFRLCVSEARRTRQRRKSGIALGDRLRRHPVDDVVPPASRSEETIQELVKRAVDRMPAHQRQAFILFELDGMTGKEVAKIGGRSLPSTLPTSIRGATGRSGNVGNRTNLEGKVLPGVAALTQKRYASTRQRFW